MQKYGKRIFAILRDRNVGEVEQEVVPHLLPSYRDEDYLQEEMSVCLAGRWRNREE